MYSITLVIIDIHPFIIDKGGTSIRGEKLGISVMSEVAFHVGAEVMDRATLPASP